MRRFIKSQNASCLASNHWNTRRHADLKNGRTSRIARLYLQTRLGLDTLIAGLSGAFTRQPMPVGVSFNHKFEYVFIAIFHGRKKGFKSAI